MTGALREDLKGPLDFPNASPGPIELRVQALYNLESNTHITLFLARE
jgi:hypothetical protein